MAEKTFTTRQPDTGSLAPILIRRDSEIYRIDGGWFRARWHFSFDQYHDPENMSVGQLRVFNHDTLMPALSGRCTPTGTLRESPT